MFLSIKSYLRVRIALAGVMAVIFAITPVFNIRQADAAIPQTINYQSRLLTPGGLAVTSTTAIQLSFYLHPTNGAPGDAPAQAGPLVWKEVYDQGSGACSMITPDAKGYFFLKLGSCNPFPAYLDFSDIMYVGVKIGADAEASPRVQLSSHPYALNAYRLNGFEATSTATANQLLALDSNLNFNIATGTFTGAGLFINGTSTLQQVTFTVATGTSLNLTQYLAIGAIRLDAIGTNNQTSGAYLVGVFDEFTNSNATTVQAALFDLDTAITTVSSTLYAMDLQQVTDNGNITTNWIEFAGGTSTDVLTIRKNGGDSSLIIDGDDGSGNGYSGNIYINGDYNFGGESAIRLAANGVTYGIMDGGPSMFRVISAPGVDVLQFGTQSIGAHFINDTRRLGLGTITPSSTLHVFGTFVTSSGSLLTLQNSIGKSDAFVTDANPNGGIVGSPGDLAIDSTNGLLYIKQTGIGTNTGWVAFATGTVADQVTLDLAYDGGGFGAGKFIITDAGPIVITNTTGTLGFMSVTHSTDAEGLWVNNLGNGSAFSARNMGSGSGFYSRNQGTGYGARFDNNTSNGIGLYVDNSNDGVGLRLDNAGANFGAWIENTGTGYGMQIRSLSPLGTGLYVRQNEGRGMLLDNNTGNRGIEINNNATGTGLFVYNMSSEPGIEMYDIGGKTGLLIDKPLNGGNAVEINTDDGARAYYNIHNGTAEAFWMRNIGTGPSLWIEDAASDPSPFVLTSAGQLGIGTAAPVTLLHVQGGLNGRAVLTLDSDDGNNDGQDAGISINSDYAFGSDAAFIEFANNNVQSGKMYSSPFDMGFMVAAGNEYRVLMGGDERFMITSTGNIGLSTSTPAYRLDVAGDSRLSGQFMLGRYASLPVSGYQAGSLVYKTSSSTINYWDGTQWRTVATAEDVRSSLWDEDHDTGVQVEESADEDYIRFDTAGVERMYIRNDGYVGIGTDNPLVSLLMVGPGSHEASSFSVAGISGMLNIANFRDENGENVFRAGGSVAGNDLVVGFGDLDYGGIGTSMQVNYGANAIELSHSELRLMDQFGGEYVGFIAPTALTGNTIWTLPSSDGTNNQVLITDGAGTLSWATSSDLVYNIYTADGYLASDRIVNGIGRGLYVSTTNGGFFDADIRDGSDLGFIHVRPDEVEMNVANPSQYSGLVFNSGGVSFTHNASASTTQFYIGSNMMLTDGMNLRGIEYAADYSANYTNRTLVDKEYVDDAITSSTVSAGNGLTLDSGVMKLGGALTEMTYIDHMGYDLVVREFAGEPETLFAGDNFKIKDGPYEVRFGIGGTTNVGLTLENPSSTFSMFTFDDYVSVTSSRSDFLGLVYDKDYSNYFVDRSLVDKGYVDSHVGALTFQDVADNTITADGYVYYDTGAALWEDDGGAMKVEAQAGGYAAEFGEAGGSYLRFRSYSSPVDPAEIQLRDNRGAGNAHGIEYAADYSADYTDRSLVDKEYVDDAIIAGNYNLYNSDGTLTSNRTVDGDAYGLVFSDFSYINNLTTYFYVDTLLGTWLEMDNNQTTLGAQAGRFVLNDTQGIWQDNRLAGNRRGVEYFADYSADYSDRSLVDKAYVDNYLSASAGSGLTWDALNNEIDLGGALTSNATINYGVFDFRIQNANNFQLFNNTNYANYYSDGVDFTNLLQNKNDIQFSGSAGFAGATYEFDYSANYTDRSLVDKEYVDNAIVAATTTLQAAYDAGGSALGRQIYTLNNANPVEILNPGTDQWETGLALTNASNGSGLAMQTMHSFGDRGAKLYFADDTSDPANASGAYMDWNELTSSFEFGYQTAGTRNSSFYIDYNQMALNVPGTSSNGAFKIQATNYNVPVLTLGAPAVPSSISMQMSVGTSTPESRVTANSGSVFFRTDGTGSSQQLYVKTTDGSNTGWFALAGADSNHWQKNTNVLSPTDSAVYQIGVTNNNASTLTGFKAVNTNDASNYAGAVLELKGSGADYTNNLYFGKYGSAFYVPSWAGNGVLATDKNLVIGAVGATSLIRFQVTGGYTAPASKMTLDTDSLDLLAGVSLNVGGNTVLGDATSDTITFTARANSSLLPATTNLYSLGSTTNRWSDLWAGTVHVGTSTWDLAQAANGALTIGQNGGSERMRITSTGYVGIGTTTPAYRLDLVGDARISAQLMLGQYALNPASGNQAGAMIYNTASSTPFFWNGSDWVALAGSGAEAGSLWDADHDTGIQVEESTDEDIIRFDTAGTEYFTMQGPRLSVLNSGNSVFFGQNAGRVDNLSNRQNVYVGTSAGYNSATGLYNVAMGYQALYNHAAPNNTTAIGHSAGRNYSGAFGSTMVGYYAGYQSSGNNNVMIGYESGMENTGSDNFFMGRGTGWYNTGNNNIMMGYYTGYDARGSNNIFFGTNAGYENRGSDNIFLGVSAGSKSIGNDNIFLGYQAGVANATGTRNVFLGRQAGNNNVLGSGNIFLGYQAGYSETNSNRLYIDNSNTSAPLIYGEFDTNVLRINGALQINNPSSTGYALPTTDGNSGQILITNGAGNVSWVSSSVLGTDTFQDVTDRGATTTNWIQFAGATSAGDILPSIHDTYSLGNTDYRWSDIWGTNLHVGTSTWDLAQADNGSFTISQRDNSEMMRVTTDGYVGIGVENPEELLSLNDDILIGQFEGSILPIGGYNRQLIIRATDGQLAGTQGTAYTTYQRDGINYARVGLDTSNNINFGHYDGSWSNQVVISTSGNMGIGVFAPSRKLQVQGSTTPGDNLFRIGGGANGAYLSMYASTTDDRNMVIEVQRNLQFYSQANAVMSLNNDGSVGFGTDSIDARINAEQSAGIVASFNRTNDDGTIVSLRQDGVEEGTISVSDNTISYNAFTGSHYAWTDEAMEKGLLVTLTGENRYLNGNTASEIIYGVTKSSAVNDSKVIGAYLSLQEPSKAHSNKNPHLIMAVGNGEVWVADKGENINIGDYLISSDVAGHAEKDTGEFMVSHIVARAAQSVDWTHVSETINGVKHRKISVFFESFDKNNMQGSLAGTSLQGGENNVEAVDLVVANAVFEGNVTVKGHLAMGRDTVGQAMVLVGDTRVRVDFEEDYGTLPIITLTPAGKVTVPYWVENASLQGFDLVLDTVQYTDVIFNWHAFGSHEGKVFVSNGTTLDIETNDMGTSELETQISANGTTPVPSPVEETEPVAPIADQPVPEEPEVVDEPAVVDEGTVEQNEYSEELEIVVQEDSQPIESIVPEPETELVPQAEIIEEQVIE